MKIAIVEPHLELYGGIRRIMELSNRLVRLGEDVTIYHPAGTPCTWMEGLAPTRPLTTLKDDHYNVVMFNDAPDYRVVRRARADLRVYYVLDLAEHEKLTQFNPKIFWMKKGRTLSTKRALQMPFLRIANATWMQRFIQEALGLECELLLGGINRDVFHPVDVPRQSGGFRILCSGDPRERKGTATVEAATAVVRQRFPDVELDTYYGQGIPQSELAERYGSADLFCDAQSYAGWNNPVAEAMACGVPVVCTDIGGVSDFAVHEETALLVPVNDAREMASAIGRMIEDAPLRGRLRAAALERVGAFDWDISARQLKALLEARLVQAR